MKADYRPDLKISAVFGLVTFAIAVFFLAPRDALRFGGVATAISILVFTALTDINVKKYEHVEETIEQAIDLKDAANFYSGKLIANGMLYLTTDRLIFISCERKPMYREEILLSDIKRASYGRIFKHIHGLKLLMGDSTVKGFVLKDFEQFLEHIDRALNLYNAE